VERVWHGATSDAGGPMARSTATQPTETVPTGPVEIRVLGPLQVTRDGEQLRLGGPKPETVFGLLVAAAGRFVSADTLIDELWGEEPPASARATLQSHVSKLRRALGEAVVWERGAYRLAVDRDRVDAWRFEDEVTTARRDIATDPAGAARRLGDALALWRGHAFAGLVVSPTLEAEVRRLEELRLRAVEDRVDASLALGDHAGLVAQLETLTGEHPIRERLLAQHMLALYRSGRQGDALRVYDQLRATLSDELGIDPSPELRDLHHRILNQDPDLDPPRPAPAGPLTFLFTDIEDSTPLWEAEPAAMAEAVAAQDRVIAAAVEAAGGRVVSRTGDAIDAVFTDVQDAAAAAVAAQRDLADVDWGTLGSLEVRMAIDVGDVELRGERYHGPVLNRLGRILAAGHGGQVLLSGDAAEALVGVDDCETRPLGEYRFKGVGRPQQVHQLVADRLGFDFPPLRLDRTPVAPDEPVVSVRGYELREVLGEGDFGFVYRAYQPSVAREVAVKVIRPEYANQPAFIRRFEAEARFIAQLEHPHIVGLYDFWREPEGAYLVMPLRRGGSVADTLQRGPWNLGPALHLLEQVGSALSYAHRNGVAHRDLKPGNVLLDEDGNAYLSDFGIATRLTDAADDVVTSSLPYVPPEELRGEELTPRSDIFSLGVLTFALLTGVNPSGRTLPALSDARPDLPAELGEVLDTATHDQPSGRYERVEDLLRALRRAVGADVSGTAAPDRPHPARATARNPYKGLRAFQDTDAGDFYGRETLVDELLQAITAHRLVAIVGASGSGKSSVVRAGLVPALRAGRLPGSRAWLVADMFPGSYPFEELESALLRVAVENPGGLLRELRSDEHGLLRVVKRILPADDSELVLLIDQFEELFSLVDDEATRRLFLGSLAALARDARGRVRVVLTLRADFFDQPLDYPGFGDLLKAGIVPVTPPSEESLGQAISRPARSVGLELEPGLVAEIIADVRDQPGGLPLLQYALTELFRRREDDQLTIAANRATGGVVGALGRRAEELYLGLSREAQEVARQLFLRLVTVDEEVDDTRRRVSQSELDGLDVDLQHLENVLQQYASYRLLTFDRDASTRIPTVEVAHEALIREWSRLGGWIEEQRGNLILHRRLQAAVRDWSEADEDPSYLLRGGRLEQAERWAAGSGIVLSQQEDEYLAASRRLADEEEAATRQRRRSIVAGLATALVVVATLALVAAFQWRTAAEEARVAAAPTRCPPPRGSHAAGARRTIQLSE
jgi:DNA-binding SARP family transcriptional activator